MSGAQPAGGTVGFMAVRQERPAALTRRVRAALCAAMWVLIVLTMLTTINDAREALPAESAPAAVEDVMLVRDSPEDAAALGRSGWLFVATVIALIANNATCPATRPGPSTPLTWPASTGVGRNRATPNSE
jgi:hypothetical protein